MTKNKNFWIFFAALACVFWGVSGLFAKSLFDISLQITPIWLTQVRMIAGGIFLVLLGQLTGKNSFAIWKNKKQARTLILYAILGLIPVQFFYFIVIQHANASIATILQFIGPFFVMAYMTITHQQVLRLLDIIAAVMAFIGVVILATHGDFKHLSLTPYVLFFGLLSAIGVATNTLIPRHLIKEVSSFTMTGWGLLIAGVTLMIIHPNFPKLPNTWQFWVDLLGVIVIGTIIPFQWMTRALRYVEPSTLSLLDAFEPLSATIGSVIFFGLVMTPLDWIGSILIILSVLALNIKPKKNKLIKR